MSTRRKKYATYYIFTVKDFLCNFKLGDIGYLICFLDSHWLHLKEWSTFKIIIFLNVNIYNIPEINAYLLLNLR